jgi:methionyl-tRNA formyltransferase
LRLAFAGTPRFAVRALEALHEAGHDIRLVLTQPSRPSGRGMRARPSPVALASSSMGFATITPARLNSGELENILSEAGLEVMVVAAYGLILPKRILAIPVLGCLNIHASLLPKWRGAAPIQRSILAGDRETGVSIMQMEPGLDTGPVILERRIPIAPDDTTGSLTDRLAEAGALAIVEALSRIGVLEAKPQDSAVATYAAKLEKAESMIDWNSDAVHIDRLVRACNPSPGAQTRYDRETLKVWGVRLASGSGAPGTVIGSVAGCPVVACRVGALALTIIQRPGAQRLAASEFVKARAMPVGSMLG